MPPRIAPLAAAVGAGLLLTAGLPPFGWWPLAVIGVAVFDRLLAGQRLGRRTAIGAATGIGFLGPGLWWMQQFSLPGWVLAVVIEVGLFTLAAMLTPPGRWRWLALPGALVVAEAARGVWPFGGVPIATLAQTQIGGRLDDVVRLGGTLLLAGAVGAAGVALAAVARRAWVPAAATGAVVVGLAIAGHAAPNGRTTGLLDVAAVQGGGPRGTRAVDSDSDLVFERHLEANQEVDEPVSPDVVLWPEDVVDVDGPVLETPQGDELSDVADALDTTLVVGVVEGEGDRFRNAAVAWGPDGEPVARYEKVHRVPFGEYVPLRSVIDRVADLSAIPRDAIAGTGPGILRTPAGDLGVLISYEVFFADRADAAVEAGAEVLLIPTNASSYGDTQMPALEVGAARLRALETGRWAVQAAPTGFSAVIDPDGRVVQQSDLGERAVLRAGVDTRAGRTIYTRVGDWPAVVAAALLVVAAWVLERRELRSRRPR